MEKVFSKEELKRLNDVTFDKLKLKRNKRIFTTFALLVALVGSVGVAKMIGVDQATLDTMAQGITIANGVVANFGIFSVFRNNRVIKTFPKGWKKLETGEMEEDFYFEHWLGEAWSYIGTNYEAIQREIDNGKEHSL